MLKPFYEDEYCTLYNGDSRDILPQLPHADLILTDPPYGINLEYRTWKDGEKEWFDLMDNMIPKMRKAAEMVIMPACQIARLKWFYEKHAPDWIIAWYKGSPGQRSFVGFSDWEPLLVYGKCKGVQMHDHFMATNDEKMGAYGHPCPKPLKWAKWLIERACKNGTGGAER